MSLDSLNMAQTLLLVAPVALVITMIVVFRGLHAVMRPNVAYFIGFVIYWVGWCIAFPWLFLGTTGMLQLFQPGSSPLGSNPLITIALLAAPPLAVALTALPRNMRHASVGIVILSLLLALVNAPAEEMLWRGLYTTIFPGNFILGAIYPAVWFAIWHVAPQTVKRSSYPGGVAAFVFASLLMGLIWSWVAYTTGNIALPTISHVLMDFLGFGALAYYRER